MSKNIEMQVKNETGYETIYPVVTTVIEQNKNLQQKFWRGTQAEYNAITKKDANTMYIILDGAGEPIQYGDMLKDVYDPTGKEQDIFAYAIPTSEKGVASGVATLDTNGKVPSTQLPTMDYIPTNEKGANSGVATLDSNGKVLSTQLPDMDYIPTSEKGNANGVASLGNDGKVPTTQLPDMDYAPAYTYGTEDLTAGTSPLETGKLYFVYE